MKITNKIFNRLIGFKNRQISLERERNRALGETNSILSAYVAILVDGKDTARISRKTIRDSIGRYTAEVTSVGDEYVIRVISADSCTMPENRECEEANG